MRVDQKPIEIAVQLNTILALFKPVTTPNFLPISDRFLIDTAQNWGLPAAGNSTSRRYTFRSVFLYFLVCLIVKVKRRVQHNFFMYNDDGDRVFVSWSLSSDASESAACRNSRAPQLFIHFDSDSGEISILFHRSVKCLKDAWGSTKKKKIKKNWHSHE